LAKAIIKMKWQAVLEFPLQGKERAVVCSIINVDVLTHLAPVPVTWRYGNRYHYVAMKTPQHHLKA
jgi:hypothetical protein